MMPTTYSHPRFYAIRHVGLWYPKDRETGKVRLGDGRKSYHAALKVCDRLNGAAKMAAQPPPAAPILQYKDD